jgi:hypothetical protein
MFPFKTRQYFILIVALTAFWTVKSTFRDANWRYNVLTSDGRGYYAFLPAFFVFQDNEYEEVKNAELAKFVHWGNQNYIYITKEGRRYNKCFPGVAMIQTPSFLLSLLVSRMAGQETTGYSDISLVFLMLNGWIFGLLGLWLMYRNMRFFTQDEFALRSAHFAIGFATFLFFYLTAAPSFSHVFSFAILNLFVFLLLKIREQAKAKFFLFLGLTLGLVFIIRPTNVLVVFFLFFLLGSKESTFQFLKELFSQFARKFVLGTAGFAIVVAVLPLLWYWQSGYWVLWSYDGEGFYFNNPQFFKVLFSYHTGIFVHMPLLFLALFFALGLFKENVWRAITWLGYFSLLVYVISSWWSYDYGSALGNRAFSEHMFIFAFPLAIGIAKIRAWKPKIDKWILLLILVLTSYTWMRVHQHISGIFPTQRFTQETFWRSMFDLKKNGEMRYFWLQDVLPFAKSYQRTELKLSQANFDFDNSREFGEFSNFDFPPIDIGARYFIELEFDKKLTDGSNWINVLLVADGLNSLSGERNYITLPIYNFYREGLNLFHRTSIVLDLRYDQKSMNSIKLYFWNIDKKSFEIRNMKAVLVKALH